MLIVVVWQEYFYPPPEYKIEILFPTQKTAEKQKQKAKR